VAARLGRPLFAVAGPADEETAGELLRRLPAGIPLAVARGLEVAALAALLAGCAGYLGNDSGVSHLAAALGVPSVVVFGPTDPARWAPLGPQVRVVRSPAPPAWPEAAEVLRALQAALGPAADPDAGGQPGRVSS